MSDFNQNDFDSFCVVITDMLKLFEELIDFENKKLDTIAANEVAVLDQYMNDEQAYLMKMRGIENRRERVQKQLGVPDLSFREIIEKFEGPEKETLNTLYEQLSSKTIELKDSIAGTKRYIDLHLNAVTTLLERLEGNNTTYGKSGEKEEQQQSPPQRFTPTKA